MKSGIEARLEELGVLLPEPPAPAANYAPFIRHNGMLFVSGQLPAADTGLVVGKLGQDIGMAQGKGAARLCAINILSQVNSACGGDWGKVERIVKITGFVNSDPNFQEHPAVVNGASDFLVEVLGEKGVHSRSAVGVASLPFGAAVEVEAIVSIALTHAE